MASLKQIEANRRNARKSTGPITQEGKNRSRCNAVRHGLTAETVISTLEDADDYQAFEATVIADYDAQSAVERELVLRLASLLWRLRRATAIETGLFEVQAGNPNAFRQAREANLPSRDMNMTCNMNCAIFGRSDAENLDYVQPGRRVTNSPNIIAQTAPASVDTAAEFGRCFLRLANLPNYVFDRLSRYEITLWRQVGQILTGLDALDRRKPQERRRPIGLRSHQPSLQSGRIET
jgi:hypothetical protein